jgi:hypothetical protein
VIGKSLPTVAVCFVLGLASIILKPALAVAALACTLGAICMGILLSSLFCLLIILFPDVDDPTQKGFRALMGMLGFLISLAPGVGVFIGVYALTKSTAAAAATSALLNFGIAALLSTIAGHLYRDFNPSE